MRRSGTHLRGAFTLIELLVVVSIIAIVLAITLPALQKVMASTRGVNCQSNLRGMMNIWTQAITQRNYVIPYTKSISLLPNWRTYLTETMPNGDAPFLNGTNIKSFNACPQVQEMYRPMFYPFGFWGYTINSWWSNDGAVLNEQKSWNEIASPSAYPWFMDTEVYQWTSSPVQFNAAPYVPYTGGIVFLTHGVGAPHQGNTVANVAYADGSVRPVPIEVVLEGASGGGSYTWFEHH